MNEQNQVAANTAARGYRKQWTARQFAARQVAKLQEKLGELARHVHVGTGHVTPWWNLDIVYAARMCREAFDGFDVWKHADIVSIDKAKSKLAGIQVVVFDLAQALGEINGEPFDVTQAAVDKSAADIERGM